MHQVDAGKSTFCGQILYQVWTIGFALPKKPEARHPESQTAVLASVHVCHPPPSQTDQVDARTIEK